MNDTSGSIWIKWDMATKEEHDFFRPGAKQANQGWLVKLLVIARYKQACESWWVIKLQFKEKNSHNGKNICHVV